MESRNTLGIYLRKDRAVVVRVAAQGRDRKLLDCFSVSVADQEEPSLQALAERVGQVCAERRLRSADAAVALDCQLFMQHRVHSDFSDYKKIAATIRFDTEETVAADVTELAVAFRVVSTDETGSTLDVYTAQRSVLSDILLSLQSHGIDPVIVDPDVYCLARYLSENGPTGEASQQRSLYGMLSDARGYLVGLAGPANISAMRTFLVGSGQQRESLLAREVIVTKALAESAGPVDGLCVFDTSGAISADGFAEKTAQKVTMSNPLQMAGIEPADVADEANAVDIALAYGAALGVPEKERSVNFRNDHMPYLGIRAKRNNALKFLSFAVTILFLSLGVYFHTQWLRTNEYRNELRGNFEPDYLAVMLGKKELPDTMKKAVGDLERALRQVREQKTGIGSGESVSAKLVQTLQALNGCAAQTDLQIDSITINSDRIQVNADTSSRRNTLSVFEAMKQAGLEVQNNRVLSEGGRDSFSVTVEPSKQVTRK